MKIMQILPELNSGGVERGTVDLARELVRLGHYSVVVAKGGRLVSQLQQEGSTVICYPVHAKSLASFGRIIGLRKLILQHQPDIIHVRSRIPAWMTYLALKLIKYPQRPKLVSTFHGEYSVSRYSEIMGCGEQVIAVSNTIKQYIVKHYPRISPDKITVIHRGVDTKEFNPEFELSEAWLARFYQQYPLAQGKKILLMPGRLSRWKGQLRFIELVKELKTNNIPCYGLIAGDITPGKEQYRQQLKDKIAQLAVADSVSLLGHRSDMKELYKFSDIVFNLSEKPEPFGRTVIEALAIGTPVIAYNEGGPGEVLADCFMQGLVSKSCDHELHTKVISLLDSQPVILFNQKYTLTSLLKKTISIYHDLIYKE